MCKNFAKKIIVFFFYALFITYPSIIEAGSKTSADDDLLFNQGLSNDVISHINQLRLSNKLTVNPDICNLAVKRADDMWQNEYFGHYREDGFGLSRLAETMLIRPKMLGENLAIGYDEDNDIVNAWTDSPSHKKNMLNTSFKEACVYKDNGITVLVLGS